MTHIHICAKQQASQARPSGIPVTYHRVRSNTVPFKDLECMRAAATCFRTSILEGMAELIATISWPGSYSWPGSKPYSIVDIFFCTVTILRWNSSGDVLLRPFLPGGPERGLALGDNFGRLVEASGVDMDFCGRTKRFRGPMTMFPAMTQLNVHEALPGHTLVPAILISAVWLLLAPHIPSIL